LVHITQGNLSGDIATLRRSLSGGFVFGMSVISPIVNHFLDQFALFPEIIAVLCLFAGAVIIANTVALSMMERRREIGIMKAVGATRRFVLQELLTENAIIGFMAAAVGTALALAATAAVDSLFVHISGSFFDLPVVLGMLALGTGLAMAMAALTAYPPPGRSRLTCSDMNRPRLELIARPIRV